MPVALDDQDIASFKALGAEVCLAMQAGEVWLVPAYTGQDRTELSIEHAVLLVTICSTFPGATVTSLRKRSAGLPGPSQPLPARHVLS